MQNLWVGSPLYGSHHSVKQSSTWCVYGNIPRWVLYGFEKRKDFFRKLTKDHSYVQQLMDEGKITKEESLNHPKKNMLMKALGCTPFIEPDAMVRGFLKDDVFLMCSDGLTNMVPEEEICRIIRENPTDATKLLVQQANDLGGRDNITAIIIR